jgi:hypothetical protein
LCHAFQAKLIIRIRLLIKSRYGLPPLLAALQWVSGYTPPFKAEIFALL